MNSFVESCLAIREVAVSEMPHRQVRSHVYDMFYRDIKLRLERTNRHHALCCEFESYKEADLHQDAVRRRFTRDMGDGAVRLCVRKITDGRAALYISRGPNYGK